MCRLKNITRERIDMKWLYDGCRESVLRGFKRYWVPRERERERERDLRFCIICFKEHQVRYSKPVHTYALDLSIELFLFQFGPVSSDITEIYPKLAFCFAIFANKYEIFRC